jgi:putative ABC transport system permease protein
MRAIWRCASIVELERSSRTIHGYAAYYRSQYNVTGGGPLEALTCTIASSTLFRTLGVRPIRGSVWPSSHDFTRQFEILLSHHVWQQRFGGQADVVGRLVQMDGHPYRVAGVLPAGFDYPLQTDVFRSVTDYNADHVRRYSVVARVQPGHSVEEAQAELDGFSARFAAAYPDANQGVRLRARLLRDAYIGDARPFVLLLVGAVALLLLIACVNVANLFLSRAVSQQGLARSRGSSSDDG